MTMCTPAEFGQALTSSLREAVLIDMMRAFRSSGGIQRDHSTTHPIFRSALAPICFEHDGVLWLPKFQFDDTGSDLRPECRAVLSEFAGVFDGWEQAVWFARPNLWLGGARPVHLLDSDASCVLGAARADRFIAVG
jgi:hypothetical protein